MDQCHRAQSTKEDSASSLLFQSSNVFQRLFSFILFWSLKSGTESDNVIVTLKIMRQQNGVEREGGIERSELCTRRMMVVGGEQASTAGEVTMTARAVSQNMKLCRKMLHFSVVSSKASPLQRHIINHGACLYQHVLTPIARRQYRHGYVHFSWETTVEFFLCLYIWRNKKKVMEVATLFFFLFSGFGSCVQHVAQCCLSRQPNEHP